MSVNFLDTLLDMNKKFGTGTPVGLYIDLEESHHDGVYGRLITKNPHEEPFFRYENGHLTFRSHKRKVG